MFWLKAMLGLGAMILVGVGVRQLILGINLSVWNGQSQLVLALGQGQELSLLRWRPKEKEMAQLTLPENLLLPLGQNYGEYKAGSVVKLDQLEKGKGGIVKRGLQEALGIGIDAMAENLTWWDRWRWWWQRRGSKKVRVELTGLVELIKVQLPDGTYVYRLDQARTEEAMSRWLVDEEMRAEPIAVTVINATGRVGLGGRVSRILTNMGVKVVRVDNSLGDLSQSYILVSQDEKDKTGLVRRWQQWLEIDRLEWGETSDYRAEAVVFVAKDYASRVGE